MRVAYIGMGANLESRIGSPAETLAAAVERLQTIGRVVRRSSLYLTEPIGYEAQPRFTNAVVALETVLSPSTLLHELMAIEKEFGRNRSASFVNGPRTLDLDVLLLGDLNLHEAHLDIPHPRLTERGFVLVPLAEIGPEVTVPGHEANVTELLERLRASKPSDVRSVVPIRSSAWIRDDVQTGRIRE